MTTHGILKRAPQLVLDGNIPIEAVTPATDTECYRCGKGLTDVEGHVVPDLNPRSFHPWTLLCTPCRDAETTGCPENCDYKCGFGSECWSEQLKGLDALAPSQQEEK